MFRCGFSDTVSKPKERAVHMGKREPYFHESVHRRVDGQYVCVSREGTGSRIVEHILVRQESALAAQAAGYVLL